jgi:hypothetical protein
MDTHTHTLNKNKMPKSGIGSNSEQQRIWKTLIANPMDTIFIRDSGNTNKYSRKKGEYIIIYFIQYAIYGIIRHDYSLRHISYKN